MGGCPTLLLDTTTTDGHTRYIVSWDNTRGTFIILSNIFNCVFLVCGNVLVVRTHLQGIMKAWISVRVCVKQGGKSIWMTFAALESNDRDT
jgi:hypothetical protein